MLCHVHRERRAAGSCDGERQDTTLLTKMLRKLRALQMLQMLMKMLLLLSCDTALTSCCVVAEANCC